MRQNTVAKFNFEFCSKTRTSTATSHFIAKLRFLTVRKLTLSSLLKIKERMKVIFSKNAEKQVTKLDKPIQKRIFDYMEEVARLDNPRSRGKGLVGDLRGLWRYRVGDYRILCHIQDDKLVIGVVEIGHRKEVYE